MRNKVCRRLAKKAVGSQVNTYGLLINAQELGKKKGKSDHLGLKSEDVREREIKGGRETFTDLEDI